MPVQRLDRYTTEQLLRGLPFGARPKSHPRSFGGYFVGYRAARHGLPCSPLAMTQYRKGYLWGVKTGTMPFVAAPEGKDYLAQVLRVFSSKEPPFPLPEHSFQVMNYRDYCVLQDWCKYFAQPGWVLGITMMEAAERVVRQALESGALPL